MENKIKRYQKQIEWFISQLGDIKFVGMLVFLVIVLLISWSGVKAIQSNYGLQKQIATIQQQNSLQQLKNNNLQLQNDYFNSNQYLELSARQNFGLAAAGETELLVPKSVALAHTANLPTATVAADKPADKQPVYQKNFEAWVNFFLHRQNSAN
jgi:cell division protein FtsB